MPNTLPADGEAMAKPPTINDLQADLSRLRSLLEVADDLVGDITAHGMSQDMKLSLYKAQNVTSVAMEFAQNLDLNFDAYMAGRNK
ncbi:MULTISPECIES: hypothetical protein [unclassified Rhizobium]|uniref:hypothetical protein n=1 Tax=unclassified Rhizobium TaxID=2613769 RepID=UPI00115E3E0D|nr:MULTISPECIES: hypothetical protein [unclassified Rhizobium]TQX88460.1 hypothetical protein EQW76_11535 [Rhizobium sp. rho-13.1]TQY12655.1 hypothetical protein EQW74_15180 [Rhizobium sp. rho-1.1]